MSWCNGYMNMRKKRTAKMYKTIEDCVEVTQVVHKMLTNLGFNAPEIIVVATFLKDAASSSVTQAVNNRQSKGLMMQELEKVMKHGSN